MRVYESDVVVVGAGGAGLRAAIEARVNGADVLVINKGTSGETGCTKSAASDWMAFGAAFGHADPKDAPREHWIDIMVKGGLVCEPPLCRNIAFDAPDRLMDLENWGADFDKTDDGKFVQILSDGWPGWQKPRQRAQMVAGSSALWAPVGTGATGRSRDPGGAGWQ